MASFGCAFLSQDIVELFCAMIGANDQVWLNLSAQVGTVKYLQERCQESAA